MRVFLLLALPLLLSACSNKALTQLRAQVRGWSGGAGQVEALSDDLVTLSSAPIDAAGRFTLPLPSAQTLAPQLVSSLVPDLPRSCTNTVGASDPAARFYMLSGLSAFPQGGTDKAALTLISQTAGDPGQDPRQLDKRVLIYASADTRVQGELRCPLSAPGGQAAEASATYALNLKAGWNYAVTRQSVFASGESRTRIESVGPDGFEGWTVAE
ncbi:hypothetical protein DKM44_00385 [Deinococcus irradiatisoli]|uniref:Lipoprotein n=1 Tax=Deinococcus irradiatisoli TaxID=2202254 RepID=A0A2Z3J9Y0_9DEIO|nr:hypothetical protein [Deinococcus irradiatisoli]AWN21883.1 hypothetical protein DKM44_00385 [Deinococcus irradiatisoli]